MGMSTAPGASASAAPAGGDAPKKSSCGCVVVGARGPETGTAAALGLVLGLAAIGSRRIHRVRRSPGGKR
jgi:hypothetical protein